MITYHFTHQPAVQQKASALKLEAMQEHVKEATANCKKSIDNADQAALTAAASQVSPHLKLTCLYNQTWAKEF